MNFAPSRLRVARDVRLKNVDLSIELETLSFYLAKGARLPAGRAPGGP